MASRKLRIGVVFDFIVSEYSSLIIEGVKAAAKDFDVNFIIFSMGELHDLRSLFAYQNVSVTAFITKKNLDGAIFISATQMHFLSKAEVSSYIKSFLPLPIVNISTQIPGIPSVTVECYKAYEALISDLVNFQECKRFGILGVRINSNEVKSRRNAIKEILAKQNIPQENITLWRAADYDYREAMAELEYHYKVKQSFDFDAILCLNDEMAYAALDFCSSKGYKVPEEIAIVGFDDIERSAYCSTPLTSINQKIYDQGYKAVELLLATIRGEKVPANTVVEATAVIRESTSRKGISEDLEKSPYAKIGFRNHFYSSKYSGTEWYYKKDQFLRLTQYYTELQSDMTSEELRRRLNEDIYSFGINECAIILYENPIEMSTPFDYFNLPHKARVYTAFNKESGYDSNNEELEFFNPKNKMLPNNIFELNEQGAVVFAIYHNTLQYGYMIFRPGEFDVLVYDMLVKILSTVISSIYSFALVHSETKKFRAKYDKLDVIASTDELTGLNNRRGLYDLGETALELDEKSGRSGIIIYCDMDGLKHINDTIGHEAGDRAILAESIILKGNFRSNDIIARIGGDEFAIICPGLTMEAFERIKAQIDEDCDLWSLGNSSFVLSISMGCVQYPSEKVGYHITPLLSEADALMYVEKRRKKELKAAKSKE